MTRQREARSTTAQRGGATPRSSAGHQFGRRPLPPGRRVSEPVGPTAAFLLPIHNRRASDATRVCVGPRPRRRVPDDAPNVKSRSRMSPLQSPMCFLPRKSTGPPSSRSPFSQIKSRRIGIEGCTITPTFISFILYRRYALGPVAGTRTDSGSYLAGSFRNFFPCSRPSR